MKTAEDEIQIDNTFYFHMNETENLIMEMIFVEVSLKMMGKLDHHKCS